jgi:hypothetical protein
MLPEEWATATANAWPNGVSFRRKDVLKPKLWPPKNDKGNLPDGKRHPTRTTIAQEVDKAIAKLEQDGRRPSQKAVEQMVAPRFYGGRTDIREISKERLSLRGLTLKRGHPKNSPE